MRDLAIQPWGRGQRIKYRPQSKSPGNLRYRGLAYFLGWLMEIEHLNVSRASAHSESCGNKLFPDLFPFTDQAPSTRKADVSAINWRCC